MRLILGSQSPRRKEILSYFSLPFEQVESNFSEESILFQGNPESYVFDVAAGKAKELTSRFSECAILTADTIVYRHGKIYGKPKNEKEALATLAELAGSWHSVFTGIILSYANQVHRQVEETRVLFNSVTSEQIKKYHDKLDIYDKAGSYQLQMAGGLIVNKIDGCYYNVIGLPINAVRIVFQKIGIDLWDYLK